MKRVVLGEDPYQDLCGPNELDHREEEREMLAAIHQLPTDFREIILLYYYQNMGIPEIAESTGMPEGTISSRLSRARKKLKSILAPTLLQEKEDSQ